jgi:hypothetical protein
VIHQHWFDNPEDLEVQTVVGFDEYGFMVFDKERFG